jgi:Fe-Mn family superoxide dismutase
MHCWYELHPTPNHVLETHTCRCTGTEAENKPVKDLVIDWARDPQKAYEFNIASMAHNNHFFFLGINSDPNVVSSPSSDLTYAISENFSSLDSLRREFIATANAMFGPGFVWLVQENDGPMGRSSGSLRIMATYLAGSPLSGAHYRRQQHDLNTHNPDSFQQLNPVGSFGRSSANQPDKQKPYGGVDISPLLCVDTWEHVWLPDYGIRGKEEFLEAWWDKIDWNVVESKARLMPANKGIKGANQFI